MPKQIHRIEDFSGGVYTSPEHLGEGGITATGVIGTKNNITSGNEWGLVSDMFDPFNFLINSFKHYIWNSPIDLSDGYTEEDNVYLVSQASNSPLAARKKGSLDYSLEWINTSASIEHFHADDNILYYSVGSGTRANYFGCFPKKGTWMGYSDSNWESHAPGDGKYWGKDSGEANLKMPSGWYGYDTPYNHYRYLMNSDDIEVCYVNVTDDAGGLSGKFGWSLTYTTGSSNIVWSSISKGFPSNISDITVWPVGKNGSSYIFDKRCVGAKIWFQEDDALEIYSIADIHWEDGVWFKGTNYDWMFTPASGSWGVDGGYARVTIGEGVDLEEDFSTIDSGVLALGQDVYEEDAQDYRMCITAGGRKYAITTDEELYVSAMGQQDILGTATSKVKNIPAGGGDVEYIHVSGEKIFLFKELRLDVLTVLHDDEFGMTFMQSSKIYNGMGIWDEKAVCLTQLGLIWVNESGIYSLEKDSPQLFKSDKLSRSYWDDMGFTSPKIGYSGETNEIIVTSSGKNVLVYNIANESFYKRGTTGNNTPLFSFPDGDLISFPSSTPFLYHTSKWQKSDSPSSSSFSTPYLYLGNLDKDKKFYSVKVGSGGGSLGSVSLTAYIYDSAGTLENQYSGSQSLNLNSEKGRSIRLEMSFNPAAAAIIDDISIVYREIGSKTKKTQKIDDFANNKWEMSNDAAELGVMCTGFIPYKNYIIPGGNWIPNYPERDSMHKSVDWGSDGRRGYGVGLIPVSKDPTDGTGLDDDLLVSLDESNKRLKFSKILTTGFAYSVIDTITSGAYATNITNSDGYITFSQNGHDVYWARSNAGAEESHMGLCAYIERPTAWLADNGGAAGNSGTYHGRPQLQYNNFRISILDAIVGQPDTSREYRLSGSDNLLCGVHYSGSLGAADSDIEGYYGYSIVYDGGETEIVFGTAMRHWSKFLRYVYVYNCINSPFIRNRRVTGFNFWYKNKGSGDTVLVLYIDFLRGVSRDQGSTWESFVVDVNDVKVDFNELELLYEDYTAVTYEALYGKEVSYLNSRAIDYKYSQISGNRRYAIGVDNKLYISRENQIDELNDQIHDVAGVPMGGGNAIALHVESGTVYLFREDALVVLTVGAAEEMGVMRVSDSKIYAGMGIGTPEGLCEMPKGIAWANENGFFMMEESKPKNMITDKIVQKKWRSLSADGYSYVGYSGTTNELVIWLSADGEEYQFYVYNLDAETFYFIDGDFKTSNIYTESGVAKCNPCSFHTLSDGTLVGTFRGNEEMGSRQLMLNKWAPLEATVAQGTIIVPPQNCGSPEREKKFYEAIISYVGSFDGTTATNTVTARVYDLGPAGIDLELDSKTYTITSGNEIILDLTEMITSRGYAMGLDIAIQPNADFAITGIEITYREMEV